MPGRDEFSPSVVDTLARRVGFLCSNPNCRKSTAGPREDPTKSVNIGVGAHITAAAPRGPRYDASLSTEGRTSADNGIWLCQNCAKLIDNDSNRYSVELIRSWKVQAEQTARAELEGKGQLDPANTGILVSRSKLLFSPGGEGKIPVVEIGQSGQLLGPEGTPGVHPIKQDPIGALLLPGLHASQFKVEAVNGEIKFSTQISDETGKLIAEIIRNEWKVAPPPGTWDRNYSHDSLEVKDPRGRVVLQVRVLSDRIQIQGAWALGREWERNGAAQMIVRQDPDIPAQGQLVLYPINPRQSVRWPEIRSIFEYPSERHLGELRKP